METNHIYLEFNKSVANTRKQVPIDARRSGLVITYTNPATKHSITEQFIGSDVSAKAELSWLVNTNWRLVEYYDAEKCDKVINIKDGSITEDKLSESLKQLLTQKGGTIINFPDDDDLMIRSVNGRGVLSLKNRTVDETNFISKGVKILRRRLHPVEGTTSLIANSFHFTDFINTSGIYEISCMFEDDKVYTIDDDEKVEIFYDVYHHKFVLRTYQQVNKELKVVYYTKWIGKSNYINYNYIRFYDNEVIPKPNTTFICDADEKSYYFDNDYKPCEVVDNKYEIYKNILTQNDFVDKNTVYIIKYDFELGENVVIPTGCSLRFDAGRIISDTYKIVGNGDAKLENVVGNILDYLPISKDSHGLADGQMIYIDEHLYLTKNNNLTLIN